MIVVADTGPLNYLIRLGLEWTLSEIYGEIVIPQAVLTELRHVRAPEQVRTWAASPPPWLKRLPVTCLDDSLVAELGDGEREAISLALSLGAHVVLMDDRVGRREAKRRDLTVAGTLAVLLQGARRGLFDLPETMTKLRQLGFRVAAEIEKSVLNMYEHGQD